MFTADENIIEEYEMEGLSQLDAELDTMMSDYLLFSIIASVVVFVIFVLTNMVIAYVKRKRDNKKASIEEAKTRELDYKNEEN